MKQVYKLENWGIINSEQDPYKAPELQTQCLVGDRIGHGDNLKSVKTSSIIGVSGKYVETKNSLYDLGEPDPAYGALYPYAKERLFVSLTKTNHD